MAAPSEPEVIRDKAAMRAWSRRRRAEGKTVAFVPTMGFLHEGHLSLVSTAAAACAGPAAIVVSIYVNPSQFAPTEDLATYPSDFAGDLRKLAATGVVAAVFSPPDLYFRGSARRPADASGNGAISCLDEAGGDGHETWIRVEQLEKGLCGSSRPVFFRGVATVVAKLFNIVEPDIAVFGKKDYQQWRIICRMVRDLDFAIEIIGSEIVREADGLAMSSRNVHLSCGERQKALSISRSLANAKTAALSGNNHSQQIKDQIVQALTEAGGRVDYVEIVEQESLVPVERIDRPSVICVAAWFGKVRLIDNIEIQVPS
ncbi:hypothetical protein PR202_ga14182 [Eleusine coracana subsp. coracana]|uniref:Pantoate--beta-alanine ligase n=1 Tax=Eleusine coracana subsp. coracana TaxID=191504 RepID=A0AAV5CFY6_ELECO|nr:hypothetical protein QOZ80_3AG0208110 [Eleusine coracana subsp. coracana]GJM97267.1 hypothetical protein PR202_ga14182 [Eleusine coracana subsp. coracana]